MNGVVEIPLSPHLPGAYERFLAVKRLPRYEIRGRTAIVPAEYAASLGVAPPRARGRRYRPSSFLFDYQAGIAALAIRKRKFAGFIECGYGKTLIASECARHALDCLPADRCTLWVSPLMVIRQTMAEIARFYGGALLVEQVRAADLADWLNSGTGQFGITNYDALHPGIPQGRLGCLILDESSYLKSHYGAWGQECLRLGAGLEWKFAFTGTPAPNDRIEYANHAVFLDAEPSVNAFLARYFANKGESGNRWEIKPHAVGAFYRSLSHWSIFMQNPATYGWKDNAGTIPPIEVHVHDVPMTPEQQAAVREQTGQLFTARMGGITTRSKLSQIAKGSDRGEAIPTNKPAFIRDLVATWPDESTIVWCHYNHEQESMERMFPDAASISGSTPLDERERLIGDFQAGRTKILISKPRVLGFGLNLQVASRHVFSGLQDSYEEYHQCVKRSNRVGSKRRLNVHIPITEIERPLIENVLAKAHRVELDAIEQERVFRESSIL
jgi:hypothetical protein